MDNHPKNEDLAVFVMVARKSSFKRAADELEIYLQLPSVNPTQRDLLTQKLHRLRRPPPTNAGSEPATGN